MSVFHDISFFVLGYSVHEVGFGHGTHDGDGDDRDYYFHCAADRSVYGQQTGRQNRRRHQKLKVDIFFGFLINDNWILFQ